MGSCKLCLDRGIIIQGNLAVPCDCVTQKALRKRFQESCLPDALLSHTFDKFSFKYYSRRISDTQKGISYYESARLTFQAARSFARNFPDKNLDGLLFTGPVGSGKTFLACCIANAVLEKGYPVLFIVVPDLLDRIRATYDPHRTPDDLTEQEVLEMARKIPLLILDDLGAHSYTDWAKNKLYSIINYRVNYRSPLIITTNINLEDLEDFLGERTTSRIYQACRPYRLLAEMDIRVLQFQEKYVKQSGGSC